MTCTTRRRSAITRGRSGAMSMSNDTSISEETRSTYTVRTADAGKAIKVQVSFTDDAGNAESLTSIGTAAVVMGGL